MTSVENWSQEPPIQIGQRVRVIRDPDWPGPWPQEPLGVVEPIMGAAFETVDLTSPAFRVPDSDRRLMREYLIRFDEPQLDSSGDGPYRAAVIWEKYVVPEGDISMDLSDEAVLRRAKDDEALRQVIESPGDGTVVSSPNSDPRYFPSN
jgi:hypothetical protein